MAPRRDSAITESCSCLLKPDSTLHDENNHICAKNVQNHKNQTRMLEEKLIETKLRMAITKTREDYLLLELQQLKELLARKDSIIDDLQRQLSKSHACTSFPTFKDEIAPGVITTTYMVPVHGSMQRDIKAVQVPPMVMPAQTSLKNHDDSTVVSALTLCSDGLEFEDMIQQEDLVNAFPAEEYQQSLRDDTLRPRNAPIMPRQPSCASGIAFMMNYHSIASVLSSKGREGFVRAEQENVQEEIDQDALKQDAYLESSMHSLASCASGIAFMSGDLDGNGRT